MAILQCGAPKSGNFWLYKIIQQILSRSSANTTSFIEQQPIYEVARQWKLHFAGQARIDMLDITDLQDRYRISSIFQMPIDDIRHYARHTPHAWTHSPVCKRSCEVLEAFEKKVYIVRDPRDRVLSASRYYCSPYMQKYYPIAEKDPAQFLKNQFDHMMSYWVWHVFDHLRLSSEHNIHICFFEGFILDFQKELGKLLRYLGVRLSMAERTELQEAVSFNKMKRTNPDHLKRGEAGYWMSQLTDKQVEKTNVIAGPLLRYLGYPLEKGDVMKMPKNLPATDFDLLREEIMSSQGKLMEVAVDELWQ